MIRSLLIANRGEIACRIIRTARAMGIRTVAVYSDADAKALHVRQADEAVHIGPSPARESYLVGDRIIAAALETGAEAIHPGYGFLSENADFAQAVIDAGLVWVGPRPDSVRAMGLKDAAKARMIAAGVPVTPGYLGEDQSAVRLQREADAIGYPVLIKAVAGGGGKGMRRVDGAADFGDALASCRREAAASFGDDRVLIEKYILSPRHIEVQVFGDTHGNIVHLFERDCSLQRRHQKVIEEAPAPGMDEATREAICAAAVRAAKAVDYVSAGTIEFIADASEGLRADRTWFMEMNTRLQVEHPVTEEITGVDLVEWQLRVASGEPLPKRQDELAINGWAIEARLYAEDPAKGFLPSIGRLDHFKLPAGLRIESGVQQGDTITPFYDPMIAKIIAAAADRSQALDALASACRAIEVAPVRTNAAFLARCADTDAMRTGTITTGFIGEQAEILSKMVGSEAPLLAAISWRLEEFSDAEYEKGADAIWMAAPSRLFGFRMNAAAAPAKIEFSANGHPSTLLARPDGATWKLTVDGSDDWSSVSSLPTTYGDDAIAPWTGTVRVFEGGNFSEFTFSGRCDGTASGTLADGAILSPMPGRIIAVAVADGDTVAKGQPLVTLEAMKMEHSLVAPFDGTVADLAAVEGGQVNEGTVLVRIVADPAA